MAGDVFFVGGIFDRVGDNAVIFSGSVALDIDGSQQRVVLDSLQ